MMMKDGTEGTQRVGESLFEKRGSAYHKERSVIHHFISFAFMVVVVVVVVAVDNDDVNDDA